MRKLLWNLFKIAVIVMIGYGIYDNYFRTEPTHTVSVEDRQYPAAYGSGDFGRGARGKPEETGTGGV